MRPRKGSAVGTQALHQRRGLPRLLRHPLLTVGPQRRRRDDDRISFRRHKTASGAGRGDRVRNLQFDDQGHSGTQLDDLRSDQVAGVLPDDTRLTALRLANDTGVGETTGSLLAHSQQPKPDMISLSVTEVGHVPSPVYRRLSPVQPEQKAVPLGERGQSLQPTNSSPPGLYPMAPGRTHRTVQPKGLRKVRTDLGHRCPQRQPKYSFRRHVNAPLSASV